MEVVALLTAIVGLVGAVVGLVLKLGKDVREIHVMVDGRLSEALERIEQLDRTLADAGVTSPTHPPRGRPDA